MKICLRDRCHRFYTRHHRRRICLLLLGDVWTWHNFFLSKLQTVKDEMEPEHTCHTLTPSLELGMVEPKRTCPTLEPSLELGIVEPERTVLRLNPHFNKLVWVCKHPNSHVSLAERCDQQLSAAVNTPTLEAWNRGATFLFGPLSGLNPARH